MTGPGRRFWLTPARLAALYVLLFAISIGAIVGSIYTLTQKVLERESDNVINAELEGLKDDYRLGGLTRLIDTLNVRDDSWGRTGAVYLLVDSKQRHVAGNIGSWPLDSTPKSAWVEFQLPTQDTDPPSMHWVRASITQIDPSHLLLVGTDISENLRFFERFRTATYWGTAFAVLIAALVGILYVRRVAARVSSVAAACQSVMAGDLSRRLDVTGADDEFDALSNSVNLMLDRLQHQALTLRTTFDSTAHDLRAPLYRVRMRIEEALRNPSEAGASQSAMESTLTEIDRIQGTLTTLLEIARAEAGVEGHSRVAVSLGKLANEVVDFYLPEARERGLQITCATGTDTEILGNRQLLAQLLANLLENVFKFVPAPGRIDIQVERAGNLVTLIAADSGPGVPTEERERILRPFARLSRHENVVGSGLGLSLVHAIVGLYGGRMVLEDNAPGLRVRCDFPAVPA